MKRVAIFMLALGCSSSPAKTAPPAFGDAAAEAAPETPTGTSVGACECTSDKHCADLAEPTLQFLRDPYVTARHYIGSECVARDRGDQRRCCYARPAVCLCYFAFGSDETRHYEGAEVIGNRDTCDVYGRATGCLYRSCEFKGCDPALPTSCEAVCQDVANRIAADNATAFDAELRSAFCEKPSCLCRNVYRLGDQCYARFAPTPKAYDCALTDQAIIAAENPPPSSETSQPATPVDWDAAAPACD